MDELPSFSELRAKGEQNRIDFLQTDLALCFTYVDLANTEFAVGAPEAAERVLSEAENGYAVIARFLPKVQNPEQRNQMERKLAELRTALDALQSRLHH